MVTTLATEKLAKQKLEAFERLQPEFEASFYFVQEVHGQRRFSTFPVMESVHYMGSLSLNLLIRSWTPKPHTLQMMAS